LVGEKGLHGRQRSDQKKRVITMVSWVLKRGGGADAQYRGGPLERTARAYRLPLGGV